jgi:hypothetical protein
MPNRVDISHITGISRDGANNPFTAWHSTVNNQVPLMLRARPQVVKPSVSLNAGTNVIFSPSKKTPLAQPGAWSTAYPLPKEVIDVPSNNPKDKTTVVTTPKNEDKPWWQAAATWLLTDIAFPLIKKADSDPVGLGVNALSPTMGVSTIIGGGDPVNGLFTLLEIPGKAVTSTMINIGRTAQGARQLMSGEKPTTDFWTDMQNAWDWSRHDTHYAGALDKAGKPIYKKNDDGSNKILLDDEGKPIYEQYTDGSFVLDDAGNKVPVFEQEIVDLHDNIDIGTAWSYMMGQTSLAIAEGVAELATGGGYGGTEKDRAEFHKSFNNWGFTASNSNFDIFSLEQRDQITGQKRWDNGAIVDGSGNGWTPGNVLTQTLNFTGDLITDPLSYVPFGKVGTIAFAGRKLLTNGGKQMIQKRVIEDATTLTAAAEGKSTVYDNFLNFAANNPSEKIVNHVVIESITSGEKDQVAYLLGQVTKSEDAAKVLLAVEYGSTRATKELLATYPKISLAIDETIAGGYIARNIANGKLNPVDELLDSQMHEKFYAELMKYGRAIEENTFSRVLRDAAFKVSDAGISPAMAVRELTPVVLKNRFANTVLSGLEATGAKVNSFFINGIDNMNAYGVESAYKFGTKNFWLHQIVRMGSKNAKGIIDVTNIDGTAGPKFFGALNDVDRLTKGALSRVRVNLKGKKYTIKKLLTDKWLASTDPLTRIEVVEDLNRYGLKVLAEKHGVSDAMVSDKIVEELTKRRYIHGNNLNNTGVSIMRVNGTSFIYHDPYAISKGNTEIQLWNWNKVDTEFAKQNNFLFKNVATGAQFIGDIAKEFNSLFNALIVTRPARLVRDILSNAITVVGSGYGKDILVRDLQATPFLLNPIKKLPVNKASMFINKKNVEKNIEAIDLLEKERKVLEDAVLNRWNYIVDYMQLMPISSTDLNEVMNFLMAKEILSKQIGFHSSAVPINAINAKKPFVSWVNEKDAAEFAVQKHGTPVKLRKLTDDEILAISDKDAIGYGAKYPTSGGEILDALRGKRSYVQVRTKGRGNRNWQPLDKDRFIIEIGSATDKYEFRVFDEEVFHTFSQEELQKLFYKGNYIYDLDGKLLSIKDVPTLSRTNEVILEVPSTNKLYQPEYYGAGQDVSGVDILGMDNATIKAFEARGYVWLSDLKKYLLDPTDANGEAFVEVMKKYNISYIKTKDAFGRDIIIGQPFRTNFPEAFDNFPGAAGTGEDSGYYKRMFNIVNDLFEKHNQGYRLTENTLETNVQKIIAKRMADASKDTVPGTPFIFDKNGLPAKALKGKSLQDFLFQTGLKKVSKTSKFKTEQQSLLDLGRGIELTEPTRIVRDFPLNAEDLFSTQEARALESMAHIGQFSPQVLMEIDDAVMRYSDITQQLGYLYSNLRNVTGKLTKAQQARLKLELERIGLEPVPAKEKMSTGNEIRDMFAEVGYPPQAFANAITGRGGDKWYAKIRGDAREVRDQGTGFFVRDAKIQNRVYKPETDGADYWKAWTRTLNEHWRDEDGLLDPVIRKIIEGQLGGMNDDALRITIRQWIEGTPEGRKYAARIGVGKEYTALDARIPAPRTRFEQMDIDDYIQMQEDNVLQHLGYLSRTSTLDDLDYVPDDLLFRKKEDIARAILDEKEITVTDLQNAWLNPRDTGVVLDRNTGTLQTTTESTYDTLPEIWGTFADPVGRRGAVEGLKLMLRNFNRIIADTPQEVLFQTPLFHSAYKKSIERLETQMRVSTGREYFTDAELRTMEEKARSFALAETRKWVYSAQQESNIMTGVRQLVPFANATIFSAKWLKNIATERPVYLAWMLYEYNKAINNTQWYDKNGNPTAYGAKDKDGKPIATHFRLDYPHWMINILAGKSPNDPWAKDYVDSTFVSRTSIDPLFSGNNFSFGGVQAPNPFISWGLTPGPAIAVSELIKYDLQNPNSALSVIAKALSAGADTGLVPDFTKFGVSTIPGSIDLAIPTTLRPVFDMLTSRGIDPLEIQKLKIDASIYLYGRAVADPDKYDIKDIDAKMVNAYALAMYDLKRNSSFILPFATKYVTYSDIARTTFQTYLQDEQEEYDRLGPNAYTKKQLLIPDNPFTSYEMRKAELPGAKPFMLEPYSVALSKFMNEHADLFYGAVSTGNGNLRLTPQKTTVENLGRYSDYVYGLSENDQSVDVLSDIMNAESNSTTSASPYVFDQNVYNILIERRLIDKIDPAKTAAKVKVAEGNRLFRTGGKDDKGNKIMGMNELDALAFERNTPIEQDAYLKSQKQRLVEWITNNKIVGREWANSRSGINPQQYNNYANAWEMVFGEPKPQVGLTKNQLIAPKKTVYRDDVAKDNPSFFTAVEMFLYQRNQWQKTLRQRSVNAPSEGTLGNNPDIANQYYQLVWELKNNDTTGKFSEWYNTYFEGDTVN